MTQQLLFTLAAATVGFVAAIFFCVGNAFNTVKQITLQATPFWDFNEHLARSISAQKVQYVFGALLLIVSFFLQIAAVTRPVANIAHLPNFLEFWPCLVLTIFMVTGSVSAFLAWVLYKLTIAKVILLAAPEE